MICLSVASSLMLTLLLLALCYSIQTAPTHHLTIGVQGNTPTLIVTSSEIGITPETMGYTKKSNKPDLLQKSHKDVDIKKKSVKTKLNKNHTLFNKKDKLQHLTKPSNKQLSSEEKSFKEMKSLVELENLKQTFKQPTKNLGAFSKDQTTVATKMQDFEITTTTLNTPTKAENADIFTTNLQLTTLPPEEINNIPLTTTPTKTNAQPKEESAIKPQPKNIVIPPAMSTTLNPKDLDEMTTTINYEEHSNTATISKAFTKTQTETKVNDFVVSQTEKTTQISQDTTTVIKTENENDNDSYTQDPVATTENENLLLTTIETKAFTTTPTITVDISTPPPTLDTLITDNTEATTTQQILSLSLTMTTTATTTENVVDDNNNNNKNEQQQPATEYSEIDKLTTTATDKRNTNEEAKETDKPENQEDDNNAGVTFKPKQEYTTETIVMQQTYDNIKSSENPVVVEASTTQESILSATTSENIQNKMKIETITKTETDNENEETTNSTPLTETQQQQQQQTFATLKTNQNQQETTTPTLTTESSVKAETTTEAVLKLIDLEKHVLKTIDELKQPSLLMAGQHDNGHDGLKNIKKKQLIDKHYVEALLHNKQDVHVKDSDTENEKYLPLTTQGMETTTTIASSTPTTSTNKPLLMPIKHGYLGPILMEEKTFHVIHHSDNGNANRKQHLADIEAQLKKGHFVELKAKTEVDIIPEIKQDKIKDFYDNRDIKNFSLQDKDEMEMQSDQPVSDSEKSIDLKEKYNEMEQIKENSKKLLKTSSKSLKLPKNQESFTEKIPNETQVHLEKEFKNQTKTKFEKIVAQDKNDHKTSTEITKPISTTTEKPLTGNFKTANVLSTTENALKSASKTFKQPELTAPVIEEPQQLEKQPVVLSTTVFQTMDSMATKMPMVQANTLFTSENKEIPAKDESTKQQTESKISDIQIEVYDSTIDSIVASTNFKDDDNKHHSPTSPKDEESSLGKTTKPPVAPIQQERFTQYVIDRMETSTHEPINYSTIQVASGKPEPAAIEIHINVSESFGNESEDLEFSYPQSEYNNNNINERIGELLYEDSKVNDNIKLKIPSNSNNNGKELRNDEILVVEIIDTDNLTDTSSPKEKNKNTDELFITDSKDLYTTPPPPPPPPPYQSNFDRDSDTIFYISNTEVKVGESLPNTKNANEERKLKLESQFFPANYIASTHPNINNPEDSNPNHHLYEEDIILSSSRNQADSLKIYRNRNEPSPPLDVTYVGESIIEVEQSPDTGVTTTYAPDQQHNVVTPQADVIIQPAILPEISIGVPVIGELPPQIELKEIDFMPNEAQLHRSGIYDDNDNSNNMFNSDIDENTINGGNNNNNNNNHDADIVNGNGNGNNQRVDESSIQYGGDLIDESADGGFDGVEGSYPFGNPATVGKSSSSSYTSALMAKLRKQQQQQQQPNHVADYAHLYVNYGVNNMRKDELSADVKDSGELVLVGNGNGGNGNGNINVAGVNSNEQNITTFKDFLNKVSLNNSTLPFMNGNLTQNERMSNATAFSVMEDANDLEDKNTEDIINLISLAIGLFIVILPVVVTCSMFWALRYLYKKYHSNITDNGGYGDQTETKGPLTEDGVEKGEFVHEPSSSPTNSNKDAIEKYPETSNKPSTTDSSNVKFSSEKSTSQLETNSSSKTNTTNTNTTTTTATTTTMTTNSISATVSKTNDTLKLSLALSSPITQEPPPSASSPSSVVIRKTTTTTTEHIQTVHGDVANEDGINDNNDDDDDVNNVEMPGPNGSITKMTLENNLLIVETEERNDISRVARETKMDYNKDGVFVVEVARGIDSKTIPESPVTEGTEKMLSMFDTKQNNGGLGYKVTNEKNCINNEKVQIHSPPPENAEEGPRSLHQIEEVEEPINSPQLNENNGNEEIIGLAYKVNTGLSQSDLSTTSSNDSNKGYCYGNQELYVVEQSGYSTATPTGNVVLKCDVKDVKDDDRNPGNDHYLKHSPDKREESKEKEDIVETTSKTEEGGTRTSSGESPAQKQNDKAQEIVEHNIIVESKENLPEMEKNNTNLNELLEKHLENCHNEQQTNIKINPEQPNLVVPQNCHIPVEIEVHITPAQIEKSDESLCAAREEQEKTSVPNKCVLPVLEATESVTEPLVLETITTEIEDTPAIEILPAIDIPVSNVSEALACKSQEGVIENDISDTVEILTVPEKFSDNEVEQDEMICTKTTEEDKILLENSSNHSENNVTEMNSEQTEKENIENVEELKDQKDSITLDNLKNHCEDKVSNNGPEVVAEETKYMEKGKECKDQLESITLENSVNHCETKVSNNVSELELEKAEIIKNGEEQKDELMKESLIEMERNENEISETKEFQSEKVQDYTNGENLLESNSIHTNGVSEVEELNTDDGKSTVEPIEEAELKTESLNDFIQSDMESLTNCTTTLPDLVTELKSPQLQNGHAEVEPISSSLTDMENGYDSIMSLPEPPPTTDEQLISDLSEQQMDSLPPPPPPEIFNLKDLPPPLTNGNVDSPQSEESSNFYNTLPPPPPTTLEVTATTNGKVHASPLTPPASPPAHFTNNLHAGLCSQPIAVDVNGS